MATNLCKEKSFLSLLSVQPTPTVTLTHSIILQNGYKIILVWGSEPFIYIHLNMNKETNVPCMVYLPSNCLIETLGSTRNMHWSALPTQPSELRERERVWKRNWEERKNDFQRCGRNIHHGSSW